MHDDGDRRLKSVFGDAVAVMVLVTSCPRRRPHLEGAYGRTTFQVLADDAPSGGTPPE